MRRHSLLLLVVAACATPTPPRLHAALAEPAADLRDYVERQLREQGVPGATIAVLDVDPATGAERRWAAGFGSASAAGEAMPFDAVGRVASISKLYTATAAMVLAERGQLDLDAPVATYVPGFAPADAFGVPVTLRHLMGHRAGIVRESPVGHYFDPSEPSLAATVQSLNDTALVHTPGSAFKYSNPGVGVVGLAVANVTGKPFEQAVAELVLEPLALRDSSFLPRQDLLARVPHGVMWTYDGRTIPTPQWAFGYGPAANLYATAEDLVRFARSWLPRAERTVVSPAALERMWELPDGATRGCGLGFFVRRLDDRRVVGHGGAVYGFASAIAAMPEEGLAVAVICSKDFANEVSDAIADRALRALLANRRGERLAAPAYPMPLGVTAARALAGRWRCGDNWVQLAERCGDLYYDPNIGVRTRLRRATDGALVADDPLGIDTARRLTILPNGNLHDGEVEYVRDDSVPAAPTGELPEYLGEYGWDHNTLIVYEDQGQLGVLIEWVVRDLPEPTRRDAFRFPPGMYGGDQLVFERDAKGKVVAAVVGGARFARRPEPDADFRIRPVGDIAQLRIAAALATPPAQPAGLRAFDLVDLGELSPTLRLDVRYATTNNFLGTQVYEKPIAKLQRPAAAALLRVHQTLAAKGLGLVVFDAYRPWSVTKVFADATPPDMQHFVANPRYGSRHNRGCAVDLSLYDLATGEVVQMPSGFDEFTARAYPDYPGGTSRQRHFRELLRTAMEAEGFSVNEHEWWHFDFADWQQYPIGN
ncbi:MAG: hypothetical protein RL398_2204, partial [Planctomycetota bacterium]